jgi:ubiquinone/menaquinone biosynthesis C-methylase UbiE
MIIDSAEVGRDIYEQQYDSVSRFISYQHQLKAIRELEPESVLEIGIGSGFLSSYLRFHGYKIVTCDVNNALKPDVLGDVRKLPIDDDSFDVVVICQVLEHLPWEDLDQSLAELARVSRRFVVISIPYFKLYLEFTMKFPMMEQLFKRPHFRFLFKFPCVFLKQPTDGHHYWEMGRKGCSMSKVRKVINKYFLINKEFEPVLNCYHHFFVLEKKRVAEGPFSASAPPDSGVLGGHSQTT